MAADRRAGDPDAEGRARTAAAALSPSYVGLLDNVLDAAAGRAAIRGARIDPDRGPICDFCGANPDRVVAVYTLTPFTIVADDPRDGSPVALSSGRRLYACALCQGLIDAGDWDGLADWVGPLATAPHTRTQWAMFREHRIGPAAPHTPPAARP